MSTGQTIKEELIQEQILRAAGQLFQKYGLHKVTMDDVAKAIGKGRSSLYYYYKSKEEVLDAVLNAEMRKMFEEINRAVNAVSGVEEKIRAFCITKLRIANRKRPMFAALEAGMDADERTDYTRTKQALHLRYSEGQRILIKDILTHGIERGELRNMGQQEQDMLVFVLVSSIQGLKRELIHGGDSSQLEPAADALSHALVHGMKK
jgi:AcrR family transcriptional regulator